MNPEYHQYRLTPIYELEEDEYLHESGDADTIHGAIVRKFTEEEFNQKMKDDPQFFKTWSLL
jgi:hypothetical protein